MIVKLCGTSGSGKTTLARKIMDLYGTKMPFKVEGRKQPVGYLLTRKIGRSLWVPGHYETACGGCDTIKTLDEVFELVRKGHGEGHDVMFEGLLLNSDRNRTIQLHTDGLPLKVVTLSTPIDLCLESVMERRRKKNPDREPKPLNPKNTESKHKLANTNYTKFLEAGLSSHLLDREEAETTIRVLFKLPVA